MADKVKFKLVVLWEDELRFAARLLRQVLDTPEDGRAEAMIEAYRACQVALWGIDDDCVLAMLGNSEIKSRARRK